MPHTKLSAALTAVDWNKNVATFLADTDAVKAIAACNLRVAIWAKQLEMSDQGNPALCFVREMQISGQHVAALMALAMYKPAASSMRTMLEAALYYSYFRSHPVELATLIRDAHYFVDKREIIDFHKLHTPCFTEHQQALGLLPRLESWYSRVSAVVHGQIPGSWVEHKAVADIAPIKSTQGLVFAEFKEGEEVVHRLLLCTVGKLLWDTFSSASKKELLRGLSGHIKTTLGLDGA